jgi:DNA-binding CsgD family transcriptional regulator
VVLGRWLSNPSSPLHRALNAYRKLDLSQVTWHVSHPVVKRAKWLNATELSQLVERYEAGATTYDLADQFGIARETVARRLKAEGIKLRRTKITAADLSRAVELYATGLSTIKIGVILNRRHSTVWYALKTAGVQLRGAHER